MSVGTGAQRDEAEVSRAGTRRRRSSPLTGYTSFNDVSVVSCAPRFLTLGSIIGEMVIWVEGAKRGASMKGGTSGMIAIMLRSDLPLFLSREPAVGLKLLKLMKLKLDFHNWILTHIHLLYFGL